MVEKERGFWYNSGEIETIRRGKDGMFDFPVKDSQIMTVDLHDMRVPEARKWLQAKVSSAPREIREIEVVHGYRGGTALMNMVRRSFQHPRVIRKVVGLNPGSTILILK